MQITLILPDVSKQYLIYYLSTAKYRQRKISICHVEINKQETSTTGQFGLLEPDTTRWRVTLSKAQYASQCYESEGDD